MNTRQKYIILCEAVTNFFTETKYNEKLRLGWKLTSINFHFNIPESDESSDELDSLDELSLLSLLLSLLLLLLLELEEELDSSLVISIETLGAACK